MKKYLKKSVVMGLAILASSIILGEKVNASDRFFLFSNPSDAVNASKFVREELPTLKIQELSEVKLIKISNLDDSNINILESEMDKYDHKESSALLETKASKTSLPNAASRRTSRVMPSAEELFSTFGWNIERSTQKYQSLELTDGSNVRVGVIDTGIDFNNTYLASKLKFRIKVDLTGSQSPTDNNGHGTEVAGIIANISPNAEVSSYKVVDTENGDSINTIQAIIQAVDDGNQVLNVSLGTEKSTNEENEALTIQAYQNAVEYCQEKGVALVASAGNNNENLNNTSSGEIHLPGGIPGAFTVGSTNREGMKSSYSNYGENVNLSAPGGDLYDINGNSNLNEFIFTTFPSTMDNQWGSLGVPQGFIFTYGSSLSAPAVTAGIADIIRYNEIRYNKAPEVNSIYNALQEGAKFNVDNIPFFYYGELDIYNSLNLLD